jgi:hypothetical protein
LDKITELIGPYVKQLGNESEITISQKDKVKVKEASSKFGAVLLGMFNNQQSAIVHEFFSGTEFNFQKTPETPGGREGKVLPGGLVEHHMSLPGIRGERVQTETTRVKRIVDPIPELRVIGLGKQYPTAELTRDLDVSNTKLVIAINFDSPVVKWALQERGNVAVAHLLEIAATALYYKKWTDAFPAESEICIAGIQEDVASFIKKAEELKLI